MNCRHNRSLFVSSSLSQTLFVMAKSIFPINFRYWIILLISLRSFLRSATAKAWDLMKFSEFSSFFYQYKLIDWLMDWFETNMVSFLFVEEGSELHLCHARRNRIAANLIKSEFHSVSHHNFVKLRTWHSFIDSFFPFFGVVFNEIFRIYQDGNGHTFTSKSISLLIFLVRINSNTRILCAKNKRLVWKSVWECKYFIIAAKFTFAIHLAQTLRFISSKESQIDLTLAQRHS